MHHVLLRYMEWTGHQAAEHPAYLDPAFMIMLAAFDTIARETGPSMLCGERQQSSHQRSAGHEQSEDDAEHGASATAWLKSLLTFHRRKP